MDEPKLKRVRRLDSIKLDQNDKTYFTNEGYLIDHPILTSCGIFEYTNPDGSIRRELRLPEHVFAEESLKTYKGKPIIITHEAGVVNKGNVDREQIGTILTDGYQDGDDVRAEIIIHDTDAMKECGLKELSLGYNLDLVEEPGTWNGEPYDAIQTNIAINHLALVASERAGEQARFNIDGSEEPELKGGKVMKQTPNTSRADGGEALSPEEMEQAIAEYKARKAKEAGAGDPPASDGEGATEEKPAAEEAEPAAEESGKSPEEIAKMVKDRRDRRDNNPEDVEGCKGVMAQQDEDIDMLLACLEKMLAEEKTDGSGEEPPAAKEEPPAAAADNSDGSGDKSGSLNADSADEIFRQRLSICRVGDKVRMGGLENKSILDGKKAIIKKVLPDMRLDGKSTAYIDAMYDLAVNEVNKRKGTDYQRQQMAQNPAKHADSSENVSMARAARERMIKGGNE